MAELVWEDPPVPDTPFFTKDLYDKYSLAPNVRDLWAFLQSPIKNGNTKQESDVAAAKTSSCSSTEEAAEHKDNSRISKEDSCQSDEACADNAAESPEECNKTKTSNVIPKQVENEAVVAFPEPRLPYPCMSTLSINDQKTYLGFLMSKKTRNPPQNLMGRVNNEVMQFTRYLQDVAKVCADDYNFIPQGAEQYSEEFFRACLECIKTFPQLYQIHEMTSLTGGTFNPALTLTFEKQLLIMGSVDITDHKIVPADAQLASDYQSVSSENPPAKKAKDMHATVSDDANAEKLCARYEPHVCLTRDALLTLLNNHGPDFVEPWELPIWIKLNPGKGRSQKKTVYIDSPLLKTEVTIRERSHIYHEESVKLSFIKNGSKNMFHLMTELPVDEKQQSPESSQRNVVSFDNDGLDFEGDLTDLETFGETTSIKTPKMLKLQTEQNQCVASKKATKRKTSSEHIANTSSSSLEETNPSMTNTDDPMTTEKAQLLQVKSASAEESEEDVAFTEDSDEEKLIIDVSPAATSKTQTKLESTSCSSDTFITPVSATVPVNSSESPSPQKVKGLTRQPKKTKTGDQLGEILRMQTAMFNSSANDAGKCSTRSQETNSPARCTGHSVSSHQTSLVKSCVSSYLERNQNEEGQTCSTPHKSTPVVNVNSIEHKKMLSEDLQAGAEDEQDYTSPEEGNLLYKLYSLQDLLVMVRSSVSLTHSRKTVSNQNQYVPVHVLPKLEYQLNYGVECLTSSESCQLWTETLLHSSTVSYIAHINAHTSKVALLRKLPDNWKQNISCGFKPSKSLNILHHLLKKLAGLDEGRYLIVHKAAEPFVTLLKEATRKVNRGAFNLQQLHSSVPQPPASAPSPWIPVDPAVVLPFHQAHGRVPCTFPPNPFQKTTRDGAFQTNNRGAGQSKNNTAAGGNKKKKQSKRTAKRNKYIRKLIQKSV